MNIGIVNLSTIYNDDMLSDVLSRVPQNSIIVIEDIDGFGFKQEKDASKNDGKEAFGRHRGLITGPGILNAIDGISSVEESSKRFFFFFFY
jgi:hypothetical protein